MDGLHIVNIKPGKGVRSDTLYGELRNADGELLIAATLEYIVGQLSRYFKGEKIPRTDSTRLCVNCRWIVPGYSGAELSKCNAPQNFRNTSLISGSPSRVVSFCDTARTNTSFCGPNGAWFQERRPWWLRFAKMVTG